MSTVIFVAGARPNFVKIAPILRAARERGRFRPVLVHTGQHYDDALSRAFFDELDIPKPDVDLEVGSASHAVQTARILERFEPVVERFAPDLVTVVGDVNSTAACTLCAVKLGVPVAHVEAGLRSGDRGMPEEINRIVTDVLSVLHFVTEPSGVENLKREGVAESGIHLVGNVMIDALRANLERARATGTVARLGLEPGAYAVLTLHRPSNVDADERLAEILDALASVDPEMPILFPVHPRTRPRMERLGFAGAGKGPLRCLDPLPYLEFLDLMASARIVYTDSGGIQEETTILNVPCVTLRENTERPITLTHGTNRLGGVRRETILEAARDALDRPASGGPPPLWDGRAAGRIVDILNRWLEGGRS